MFQAFDVDVDMRGSNKTLGLDVFSGVLFAVCFSTNDGYVASYEDNRIYRVPLRCVKVHNVKDVKRQKPNS